MSDLTTTQIFGLIVVVVCAIIAAVLIYNAVFKPGTKLVEQSTMAQMCPFWIAQGCEGTSITSSGIKDCDGKLVPEGAAIDLAPCCAKVLGKISLTDEDWANCRTRVCNCPAGG